MPMFTFRMHGRVNTCRINENISSPFFYNEYVSFPLSTIQADCFSFNTTTVVPVKWQRPHGIPTPCTTHMRSFTHIHHRQAERIMHMHDEAHICRFVWECKQINQFQFKCTHFFFSFKWRRTLKFSYIFKNFEWILTNFFNWITVKLSFFAHFDVELIKNQISHGKSSSMKWFFAKQFNESNEFCQ